jgi:RecG-like helicase
MTGMKQAGLPGFQYLNIVLDQPIIKAVKAYLTEHH